jgi:hypothetical protein
MKRVYLVCLSLIVTLFVLSWVIGQGLAQQPPGQSKSSTSQSQAQSQNKGSTSQPQGLTLQELQDLAAANRAARGMMMTTTNADRMAAAQRNATRRAADIAVTQQEGQQ